MGPELLGRKIPRHRVDRRTRSFKSLYAMLVWTLILKLGSLLVHMENCSFIFSVADMRVAQHRKDTVHVFALLTYRI